MLRRYYFVLSLLLTNAAFLPNPIAFACASTFCSIINRGLVRPSLLNSNDSCNLAADLAAGECPCLYPTISAICSATDLSNTSRLYTTSRSNLSTDQPTCINFQNAVIPATLNLFSITDQKGKPLHRLKGGPPLEELAKEPPLLAGVREETPEVRGWLGGMEAGREEGAGEGGNGDSSNDGRGEVKEGNLVHKR